MTDKYSNGINLYAGKWKIGSVWWNGSSVPTDEQGNKLNYAVSCELPGIKNRLGDFIKESEGVERLQKAFDIWLKGISQ